MQSHTGSSTELPLEMAILYTLLYADLFEYPLTREQVFERLLLRKADRNEIDHALQNLIDSEVEERDGFVFIKGRSSLVEIRLRRKELSEETWPHAHKYARWFRHIPFVRMVAVSGSLAVENTNDEGDVDLFCITAENRLWIARSFLVPIARFTKLFKKNRRFVLCPNYLLTEGSLGLEEKQLFTAHEVVQSIPIWGSEVFDRFKQSNSWVEKFLVHAGQENREANQCREQKQPLIAKMLEGLFKGRIGDSLDRMIYRSFVSLYKRRAEQKGWDWDAIGQAYQKQRYMVPEGGYVHIVQKLFRERIESLDLDVKGHNSLETLFGSSGKKEEKVYEWSEDFLRQYH